MPGSAAAGAVLVVVELLGVACLAAPAAAGWASCRLLAAASSWRSGGADRSPWLKGVSGGGGEGVGGRVGEAGSASVEERVSGGGGVGVGGSVGEAEPAALEERVRGGEGAGGRGVPVWARRVS